MSLKERILADIKEAMKRKDQDTVDVLRFTHSEIRRGEIDSRQDYTDDDIIKVLKKGIKSREESMLMYEKGERPDLVEKDRRDIAILQKYLPQQLSIAEIESIVAKIIAEKGLSEPKHMGVIMGIVMKEYGSQVDGKTVQEVARIQLSK